MKKISVQSRKIKALLFILVICLLSGMAFGQENISKEERMQWWREARFGMFVHWGLYSGLAGTWEGKVVGKRGGMEWIQQRVKADTDTYAAAAIPLFKPSLTFAEHWAKTAVDAGCKYIVFTTKHHDGFALHDSKVSEYDAGSVLKRDLVKEIVTAARAHGLKVGFYHSVIDWHHDQYAYALSRILHHPLKGKPYPNGQRDHEIYIDYLHDQVQELVTNYGTVDILWWDYSALDFQGQKAWRAFDLIKAVRTAQPDIIMNNRLFRVPQAGWKGMGTEDYHPQLEPKYGDIITPEQHIPATGMPGIDWETCMTMNTTWGYSDHDHEWKSVEKLVRNLVDIVSKGGNYLLNVGPTADGTIPQVSIDCLRAMGKWIKINGEAIYGTTASPFKSLSWGRCTVKKGKDFDTLYLHVFDWPTSEKLAVPGLKGDCIEARILGRDIIGASKTDKGVVITVPKAMPDPLVSVIALKVKHGWSVE